LKKLGNEGTAQPNNNQQEAKQEEAKEEEKEEHYSGSAPSSVDESSKSKRDIKTFKTITEAPNEEDEETCMRKSHESSPFIGDNDSEKTEEE